MKKQLVIFRQVEFDGDIHVRLQGYEDRNVTSTEYTLLIDGAVSANFHEQGLRTAGRFKAVKSGENAQCQATARICFSDGTSEEQHSQTIRLFHVVLPEPWVRKTPGEWKKYVTTKSNFQRCDGVSDYYIEVLFEKGGALQFQREKALPLYQKEAANLALVKTYSDDEVRKHNIGPFSELYRIKGKVPVEVLVEVAEEIGTLDYVKFSVVSPDMTNCPPPPVDEGAYSSSTSNAAPEIWQTTPDYDPLQTYKDETAPGMNVRKARQKTVGSMANIRWLDFGVYRNHEDYAGTITVVNSRPETQNCHHGTASTGAIMAGSNDRGMSGIANDADFYFYDTGDLDLIVRDANAGDIVGLNIHIQISGRWLPMTVLYSWWTKLRFLALEKGVLVCLAAGNGGFNLTELEDQGLIENHGDCGAYLAGACSSKTGDRLGFSNHARDQVLCNSWGEHVATTGYGALYYPDSNNNRSYTGRYSGTSSATPLCVGAIALMQSYSLKKYGVDLVEYLPVILIATGDAEGGVQGIGSRPNVAKALDFIDLLYGKA